MNSREALPVTVDVFASASGARREHVATFAAVCKLQNLGPFTMDEWRERYMNFLQRPSKGKEH